MHRCRQPTRQDILEAITVSDSVSNFARGWSILCAVNIATCTVQCSTLYTLHCVHLFMRIWVDPFRLFQIRLNYLRSNNGHATPLISLSSSPSSVTTQFYYYYYQDEYYASI